METQATPAVAPSPLPLAWLTALTLVGALVMGGGQGWLGDRLLAVPALLAGLWGGWWLLTTQPSPARSFWILPLALVGLPLLQLVPLPAAWVALLPGRSTYLAELASVGASPTWQTWTLSPFDTERVLWAACVPAGLYVATGCLSLRQRRWLVSLLLVGAFVGTFVGLAQRLHGPESPLYFYARTNEGQAVGQFANSNHLAAFLACLLPVAAGFLADRIRSGRNRRKTDAQDLWKWLLVLTMIVLAVGTTLTRSRAGFGLLLVSGVMSVVMVWLAPRRDGAWVGSAQAWLQLTALVITVLLVHYTLYGVLLRLEKDPLDEYRWLMMVRTLEAAQPFGGWGVGLGTFMDGYGQLGDVTADISTIVNHAHNDYAELWFEGGVPAIVILVIVLAQIARAGFREWRRPVKTSPDRGMVLGSSLALMLLALHSLVDYPLRTTSIAATAAVLASLLLAPERD